MKKVLLVIFLLLGVFIPTKIYALEDSFYEAEYIPGEYIKKFEGGSGKYEQMKFFRRTSDNRPVYCIQLWETLSNRKQLPGYDDNQKTYANISEDTWNRIMLLAYYGYGYQGHTDTKWYAITQFMIWKATSPNTDIYFTNTLNGNKITKYESEIIELNSLIYNHYNKPSFDNKTFNVTYNSIYTIYDGKHLVNDFDIVDNGEVNVTKGDNSLIVSTKKLGNNKIILAKKDKLYSNKPIVYIDDVGQNVLLPGSFDLVYSSLNLNLNSGNLTVNKMDLDNLSNIPSGSGNLSNSVFQLLDKNNNIVAVSSLNNNQIIFNNIGYGNYKLKEISAGEGYKINNEIKDVVIDSTNNSIDFYNEIIKNKVIVHKYLRDSITNETMFEEDASFEVIDSNNNKVLTFKTDSSGYYEFSLPYGTYTLKQANGKKNYKYIDDVKINVIEDNKIQEFNLYNDSLVVSLVLNNLDSDSKLPILNERSTYKIVNKSNNEEKIVEIVDNGKTEEIKLNSGDYEITQITSPNGYKLNTLKIEVNINEDNYSYNNEVIEESILNEKEKSMINISKNIEYYLNDILVKIEEDSIEKTVYAKNDIYSKDGTLIYSKDEEVDNLKSNNNSRSLVFGNYYVKNNDEIVDIELDSTNIKKISFLDKVYEYTNDLEIGDIYVKDVIYDVPDTYKEKNDNKIYLVFVLIGLVILYKGRKYEKN